MEIGFKNSEFVQPSRMQLDERQTAIEWEESGALELGKPGRCVSSSLEPELPADFLLILPPIDQIMNQGTASDKAFQLLLAINSYYHYIKINGSFVALKFVFTMLQMLEICYDA